MSANYKNGVDDCRAGIMQRSQDKEYIAGYSHQYELEQKLDSGEYNGN